MIFLGAFAEFMRLEVMAGGSGTINPTISRFELPIRHVVRPSSEDVRMLIGGLDDSMRHRIAPFEEVVIE